MPRTTGAVTGIGVLMMLFGLIGGLVLMTQPLFGLAGFGLLLAIVGAILDRLARIRPRWPFRGRSAPGD
jgi:hypothetical protein